MKKRQLKRTASSIQVQVRALRKRVTVLERALKTRFTIRVPNLPSNRERAEQEARRNAMSEFYRRRKTERYLRNPSLLAADLAYEKEVADYLRSKGLKPEPSQIPEQFRRGLKKYRPKAPRT